MDYSKLSDFEINSAVHNALMDEPYKLEFLGNDKIKWVRDGTDVTTGRVDYKKNTLKDYCNNPADAWPIIVENLIALRPVALHVGGHRWFATKGEGDFGMKYADDNPLRAAMVVFLMMQENK